MDEAGGREPTASTGTDASSDAPPAPKPPDRPEAEVPAAPPVAQEAAAPSPRRQARRPRPHPYAHEASPEAERRLDPGRVAALWMGLATFLALGGYLLARQWSVHAGIEPWDDWEGATWFPLFGSLALLAVSLARRRWAPRVAIAGWVGFAAYWGLTALDLYAKEGRDIVNFTFSVVGVYFFTYLGYHQWLDIVRGVRNGALRFLHVATVVAAGSYFLIDKVAPVRLALIHVVSDHTKWMLDLFGQGDEAGLQFVVDQEDSKSPTTFFYPDVYCDPNHVDAETGDFDAVGNYCEGPDVVRFQQDADDIVNHHTITELHPPSNWFEGLLQFEPSGDLEVFPVSIVLACTALQSIMLFVGLFAGTTASLRRKAWASLAVAAVVYVLNLVRNTGIIWFYGQGHASFYVMHNVIGKGGSLLAMVGIAFAAFRWFPEFFRGLVGVLELPDRDGPLERYLRVGRRRPEPPAAPPAAPPPPPT